MVPTAKWKLGAGDYIDNFRDRISYFTARGECKLRFVDSSVAVNVYLTFSFFSCM